MKIAIASDHAALELKALLVETMTQWGHEVTDLGPNSTDSVDYPDYGFKLADHVATGKAQFGVALCGSGIGINIAANRNLAIRCAQVSEPLSARYARSHNDANMISMGARMIGPEIAKACLQAFLETEFEGGRHQRRVTKLSQPE